MVGAFDRTLMQKHQMFSNISPVKGSLPVIIRSFKSSVKHWCNKNGFTNFKWQRNYYDHIIRNDLELNSIRQYIINNPLKWHLDKENPDYEIN